MIEGVMGIFVLWRLQPKSQTNCPSINRFSLPRVTRHRRCQTARNFSAQQDSFVRLLALQQRRDLCRRVPSTRPLSLLIDVLFSLVRSRECVWYEGFEKAAVAVGQGDTSTGSSASTRKYHYYKPF